MLEEEKSTSTLFEEYFNDELLRLICTQSVIYARSKGNDKFGVTIDELKVFLAIIMLAGYVSHEGLCSGRKKVMFIANLYRMQ